VTFAGYDDLGIGSVRRSISTDRRGDWYMQYRDGGHSNRSALAGPRTNYIHWQVSVPGKALSPPVYDADGTVYVGGEDGLHAINRDGTRAWICATDEAVTGSAAVGPTGAVYFGCTDGHLRAVSPAGELIWSIVCDGPLSTGVAVADDGTVYSASGAGELLAVSPAGEQLWRYSCDNGIIDTPSVGKDGTIYAALESGRVVAVNSDGSLRWPEAQQDFEYLYTAWATASPVLTTYPVYTTYPIQDYSDFELREVMLFLGAPVYYQSQLEMLPVVDEPQSAWDWITPWWEYGFYESYPRLPTVRDDFSLLIPDRDSGLTAYGLDTTELWTYDYLPGSHGEHPVSVGSRGNIYLSLQRYINPYKASLLALDSQGELLWELAFEAEASTQPVIAPDETVYVTTSAGILYAVGGSVNNAAPQLPTGLRASAYSLSSITLRWDETAGAGGCEVFRDEQDEPVARLTGRVLKYVDQGLAAGAVHTYWIRGVNYFGASGFSAPVVASTDINSPQNLSASDGLYSDRIVLSWSKVENATGYEIFRDKYYSNVPPYAIVGDVDEWPDTGVTDWDEHTYWIRATNGVLHGSRPSDTGFLVRGTGDTGAGDWRQYGHDSSHSFAANVSGPTAMPHASSIVFDPYRFDEWLSVSDVVFGSEGCRYVSTYDDGIFALNSDGSHRWHQEVGRNAAVLDDGAVAAADPNGLVIFNPDGSLRNYDAEVPCLCVALHPSGDLIVSEYTAVTRYSPQSGEVWSYEFPAEDGSPARGFPAAIALDGTIYVCMASRVESSVPSPDPWGSGSQPPTYNRRNLVSLDGDGEKLWEFQQYGELGPPVIAPNGAILISSAIGTTYSVSPEGSLNWTIPLRGALGIAPGGMIVLSQYGGGIYTFDPSDSSLIWEYQPPDDVYLTSQPLIDNIGSIFMAYQYASPGNPNFDLAGVLAVSAGGDLLWRYDTADRYPRGLSIDNDGSVLMSVRTEIDGRYFTRHYTLRK
jgi:hypothetical protein